MIKWIIALALYALAMLVTARILPGFKVKGFGTAMFAALIIGVLNVALNAVLQVLAIPFTVVTLGLFAILLAFVINVVAIKVTSGVLDDFEIDGWSTAAVGAVVITAVNWLLRAMVF